MIKPWSHRVIYEIYPRSFFDSNGDGIGDIKGITQKLDYFTELGVDALWISPMYTSPMRDFGYDVSNYLDIDPIFGTLSDFDELMKNAHSRNLKIIMDYIPSHTSDEHPWFKESRSSRDNPKSDWYLWYDGEKGKPLNNWLSVFGGSAWEWDEIRKQYYFHSFLKEQPDLNWRNPEVKKAMFDVVRFWMDRGVDGFRVDAFNHIFKHPDLPDEPQDPKWKEGDDPYDSLLHIYTKTQPEIFQLLKELSEVLAEKDETFMVTEAYADVPNIVKMYEVGNTRRYAPFNFEFIYLPWDARVYKKFVDLFDSSVGNINIPTYVLGNLDRPRVASRLGRVQARVSAMLQLTLRGIPFIYQGEELGMENVTIPPERVQDPFEKQVPGQGFGRDPERTPMQWDASQNAGFSTHEPWLPLAENYKDDNIEVQGRDNTSFLTLYKTLLHYRRESDVLLNGEYHSIDTGEKPVFVYIREDEGKKIIVALNFSGEEHRVSTSYKEGALVCSTYLDRERGKAIMLSEIHLRPNEGILGEVKE